MGMIYARVSQYCLIKNVHFLAAFVSDHFRREMLRKKDSVKTITSLDSTFRKHELKVYVYWQWEICVVSLWPYTDSHYVSSLILIKTKFGPCFWSKDTSSATRSPVYTGLKHEKTPIDWNITNRDGFDQISSER